MGYKYDRLLRTLNGALGLPLFADEDDALEEIRHLREDVEDAEGSPTGADYAEVNLPTSKSAFVAAGRRILVRDYKIPKGSLFGHSLVGQAGVASIWLGASGEVVYAHHGQPFRTSNVPAWALCDVAVALGGERPPFWDIISKGDWSGAPSPEVVLKALDDALAAWRLPQKRDVWVGRKPDGRVILRTASFAGDPLNTPREALRWLAYGVRPG